MPATTSCPVSEVDGALSSYINSKQDTLRIRAALTRYLTTNIKVNTSRTSQHLDFECPTDDSNVKAYPTGVKQNRAAYLHALESKLKAQARHRQLQASLQDLQNGHVLETSALTESTYDAEVSRDYISLLRQRRRLLELQVIHDSLGKLMNVNSIDTHRDPKVRVKEAVGEQPDLPAERLEQFSQPQTNDASIFRLKKEVLEAKACMDKANSSRATEQSKSQGRSGLKQQVYALQCARDEIVAWVEGELAKLSEESELLEDASPVKRWPQDDHSLDVASSEGHITASYQRYTTSRLGLIESYQSIQQRALAINSKGNLPTDTSTSQESNSTSNSVKTITAILPHISSFAQIMKNERFLLQQKVYLQGQLSTADEDSVESLSRLSDESHLLASGSNAPAAWASAAGEAKRTTTAVVSAHLKESHHDINSVNTIVDLCSLQSKVLAST
jgi:hypothetical protein